MKRLLPLALLLVGCGGTVAPTPEPTPTPSPSAVAPDPAPTPNPTPQWQAPEGWMEFQAEGGQWLAIRQRPMPSCGERAYCADFDVMPSVSCRNGIYMEVQWIDSNTGAIEDWSNAYLPRLMEGQVGRMSTGIDWPPSGFNMTIDCHE